MLKHNETWVTVSVDWRLGLIFRKNTHFLLYVAFVAEKTKAIYNYVCLYRFLWAVTACRNR